jgi:hypothetical protein
MASLPRHNRPPRTAASGAFMAGMLKGREALVLAATLWTALSINDILMLPGGLSIITPGWLGCILLALVLARTFQRLQSLPRGRAIAFGPLDVVAGWPRRRLPGWLRREGGAAGAECRERPAGRTGDPQARRHGHRPQERHGTAASPFRQPVAFLLRSGGRRPLPGRHHLAAAEGLSLRPTYQFSGIWRPLEAAGRA